MANMTPQAKRLIMLGLLGIVLVGGAFVVNTYFLAPGPSPAPPVRPVLPPPPKLPVATPAPAPGAPGAPGPQGAPGAPPKPQIAFPSPGLGTPTASPAPGAPPKPAGVPPASGSYTVQVGAFAVKTNAEKMQKRLEEKGHTVTIRQGSSKVPGHRVLVGEYADKADAQAQRDKVTAAGGKGAKVVAMGAGKFTVEAGTFKSLDAAIDLSRGLQQSGLASRIDSRPTGAGLYQVQVGSYATKEDAESQVAGLRKEGLSPIVMKN